MAKVDPMDAITPLQGVLTFTGLWPVENPSLKYTIRGYVLSLVPQIIMTVFTSLRASIETGNLLAFGLSSAMTTSLCYYNIKAGTMLFLRREVLQFMSELRNTASFKFSNSGEKYITPAVNFCKALIQLITLFTAGFLIISFTYPLYQFDPEHPLPFPVVFDLRDRPFSIIVLYIYQVAFMALAGFNYIFTDLMMFVCIILARAYLKVLKNALNDTINAGSATDVSNIEHDATANDDEINGRLAYCVKYHCSILKYVSDVESAFSTIFLGQIVANLYLLCIIGFCVVTVNEINAISTFLSVYLFFIMSQFAITCAAANEIIIESSDVGLACYTANWNKCGVNVRRTLFIIMERSKRPVMLTAAKFVPLSLMTLMSVLKSSLSYFMVLNAVFGNRDSE